MMLNKPSKRIPTHYIWLCIAVMAALGYLFQLGGDHIPRNGDELVYAHIARLTAGSGHWLPLVSSYDFMRNTKPPLLFWQAMVAGGWGEYWTLLNLRLPSVLYLWATALMTGLLTWKIARNNGSNGDKGDEGDEKNSNAVTLGVIATIVFFRSSAPTATAAPT